MIPVSVSVHLYLCPASNLNLISVPRAAHRFKLDDTRPGVAGSSAAVAAGVAI